jgi:hypothetical protein
MASTITELGILSTEIGAPAEGVKWNLCSLGIHLKLGSPRVWIDIEWLVRQRELLGSEHFERIVREQFDKESANAVLDLLDRRNAENTADPGGTNPVHG